MSVDEQERVKREMNAAQFDPLRPYSVPRGHIELAEKIGEGAAGEVWVAYCRQYTVAVKRITHGSHIETALTVYLNEALMMAAMQGASGVSHPNLVQMLHCCWEEELLLVLEYFPLRSLDSMMEGAMPDTKHALIKWTEGGPFLKFARDVAAGLSFLHDLDVPIIHRDIKPENVLIDGSWDIPFNEWSARVSDFGESAELKEDGDMAGEKGSPLFMAPEVMMCEEYDHRADIYSFGVLLLHMATHATGGLQRCWKESPAKRFSMKAVMMGKRPVVPRDIVPWLGSLITESMSGDPEMRPKTFHAVNDVLWHDSEHRKPVVNRRGSLSATLRREQLLLTPKTST